MKNSLRTLLAILLLDDDVGVGFLGKQISPPPFFHPLLEDEKLSQSGGSLPPSPINILLFF